VTCTAVLGSVPKQYFCFVGYGRKQTTHPDDQKDVKLYVDGKEIFSRKGERTVFNWLDWFRLQLHEFRREVLDGNEREAHDYLQKKVRGGVDYIVGRIKGIEEKILKANIPLIRNVMKRAPIYILLDEGCEKADVAAELMFTCVRAMRRFDAGRGYKFSTYLRKSLFSRVDRLIEKVQAEKWLSSSRRVYDNCHEGGERIANGAIDDLNLEREERGNPTLNKVIARDEISGLRKALDDLPERERFAVERRYGFDGIGMTYNEIGAKLGIGEEGTRAMERRARKKLGEFLMNG
jgi:RNA polymerase sigma factor (sigma-70 family)